MDTYGFGGGIGFDFFPIIFGIVFIIILGTIVVSIAKGIGQWSKNEQSPELSVPAIVRSKRMNVSRSHHHHHEDHHHSHTTSSTTYYVTFEFNSGDRKEFRTTGKEYGLLAENDTGILTFKGTRYLGFERESNTTEL
ncbi:DUF2500 domain-containing protein [Ornithinibacillus halotolerans]|uniref:Membrane protein n=1 Tax=Ornithinibacillus halotolerans TaxID=1274357 RepID=A0A916WCL4_9BACI|nr:DUF2500 domain-containing protein [Ornithinibacillus halotolerans]GGA88781.1 membrane protein [Ornithinibacillus halotolerans]